MIISAPGSSGSITPIVEEVLAWAEHLLKRIEAIELRMRELARGAA